MLFVCGLHLWPQDYLCEGVGYEGSDIACSKREPINTTSVQPVLHLSLPPRTCYK